MRSHSPFHVRFPAVAGLASLVFLGAACSSASRTPSSAPQPGGLATGKVSASLVLGIGSSSATNTVALTAQRMTTTLRDGTPTPMWGFCVTGSPSCAVTPATATSPAVLPTWAPGPTIVVPAGSSLTINLTNALPVATSLVVPGQFGGGLGTPTTMPSPAHPGQGNTTFVGNAPTTPFVPPAQGARVRSFGTEVAAAGTTALTWTNLKPGTYIYETGTLPSLQVPMGLYGVLVVTTAPAGTCSVTTATACSTSSQCPTGESCNVTASGTAYTGVAYDDDVALLFSEMDPAQNAAVDAAAVAGTDPNKRFDDPTCSAAAPCYPAAINYAPTYFFINGQPFDRTAPQNSTFLVGDAAPYSSKNILVRLLNAGSRTHVPSIVGLPMALVAEDGNLVPGYPAAPRVQSEVLLTAGKTFDVVVQPPASAAGTTYAPNTYPVFDRALALSTANRPDGGMQGFLLVDHAAAPTLTTGTCTLAPATACTTADAATTCGATGGSCALTPVAGAPGNLPAGVTPQAIADAFHVPYNPGGAIAYAPFTGNVTLNDIGVKSVALGTNAAKGTLALAADGSFTYVPNPGTSGNDTFTYVANGCVTNCGALTASVTLGVAAKATGRPVANADTYTSALAAQFSVSRPGVLANDTDPNGFPLLAGTAVPGAGCGSVALNSDGSFTATAAGSARSCAFTYVATNSQGTASAPGNVTVNFGLTGGVAGLALAVRDASSGTCRLSGAACSTTQPCGSGDTCVGTPLPDYRWTIQEDLTFKQKTGATPSLSTRTVATSFHRAHMPVVATGCVGPVSCGSGQSVRVGGGVISNVTASATGLVTVTTSGPQSIPTGTPVTIVGITPSIFDGQFPITALSVNTFTYQLPAPVPSPVPAPTFDGATYTENATGVQGGRHVVTDAEALARQTTPDAVVLDPTKRYFVSILPGDAGSPPGHAIGGGEIKLNAAGTAWAPIEVKVQQSPLTTAQMSIYIYEDDFPTNGQNEPEELPLGGFNIILFDPAGRTGDVAGQQTYDAFNMPLSNALLGTPGCPDDQNVATNGTATSSAGNLVGVVYTCPNDPNAGTASADPAKYALAGHALIKNLTPARYDVLAHPGAAREGAGEVWWQTETLEGTPAQDAFVGLNEPTYFQEFGPPGPHVTIGFVNPAHVAAAGASAGVGSGATITGRVTNQHMSRPSATQLFDAGTYDMFSATTCRVVLNSQAGLGPAVAAAECDASGNFTLSGVPAGDYDLSVFDEWLDQIIQNAAVTVPAGATTVALGTFPELSWFTLWDQNIWQDAGNGIYDPGRGIANVPLTLRFRNGAPSNATLTDSTGNGLLPEVFPLFNWYVAEADTTRFKQTQVNIWVDGGGAPDTTGPGAGLWTSRYPTGQSSFRSEVPGAYSYGVQGFISQRSRIEWGRTPYAAGENGGIQGTVVYSSTRPFDDQRFNVQTIWEPLVPRVTVNLYQQVTLADGTVTLQLMDTTKTSSFDDFVNTVKGADGRNYLIGPDYDDRVTPKVGLRYLPGTLVGGVDVGGTPAPQAAYPAGIQANIQCPGQLPGVPGTNLATWNPLTNDPFTNYTLALTPTTYDQFRCYDGFHNWNQVQAAPYDGRYQFPSVNPDGTTNCLHCATNPDATDKARFGKPMLPKGTYVVEVVTPPGYEVVKEEDKNILIGDAFVAPVTQQFGSLGSIFILPDQATIGNGNPYNPGTGDPGFQSDPTTNLGNYDISTATTFPECVGNLHRVPDFLSLYPQAQQVAPFAGMDRPLCDRKRVVLNDQMQASAAFFVFTETPVASNNTGIVLDDASSEFNAVSPDFGEKASVPFVPISIRDFTGLEIGRTYSDQWGAYNMMTPSSWLVNPPTPSGYGPNMLVTCINDPGPVLDTRLPCTAPGVPAGCSTTSGQMINDPAFNPAYSNFCYTNPFMPGQTTYLDTPVVPVAAFASGYNPPDCAHPSTADASNPFPAIKRVDTSAGFGPWLPSAGGSVTITALGDVQVQNAAYSGPFATTGLISQATVLRHYGFGSSRGSVTVNGVALGCGQWTDQSITCTVPGNVTTGELVIQTAGGKTSVDTVTLHVGPGSVTRVSGGFAGQTGGTPGPIQQAVDAARPGDLILVDAGVYEELVVMWKPVQLQGVGGASTIVNAAKYPTSKLATWRPMINGLFSVDPVTGNQTLPSQVDPLPTQEITGGVVVLEPTVLGTEEGAGFTVLAKGLPAGQCTGTPGAPTTTSTWGQPITDSNFWCARSQIDGFGVTGSDAGGGIYVNGWAHGLEISNNHVYGNAGAFNGGIRVGVPYLETPFYPGQSFDALGNVIGTPTVVGTHIAGLGYDVGIKIHHNDVSKNGTVESPGTGGGAGAGISMLAGSDGYSVDHNWVCGNYSQSDGGGIGHLGYTQGGTIANNWILFNQSFQQTSTTSGGGIFVGGEPPIAGTLSLGAGDVAITSNLLRGNFAEGGHGGGIRLQQVNGADVAAYPRRQGVWNHVDVTGNTIESNVAGWCGGGVSLVDSLSVAVTNNDVDSNDSTGIAGASLQKGTPVPGTTGNVGRGHPSPSGVCSEPTSPALLAAFPTGPAGAPLRTANAVSQPAPFRANSIWHNRSFYYSGNSQLCVGNTNPPPAGCTVLAAQTTTGQCPGGAAYWEYGVLNDPSPTGGSVKLAPVAPGPNPTNTYCNGSRIVPELPIVLNPSSPKSLQAAATLDEGNNYVNLRYGPLYVQIPSTTASTTFGPTSP